MTQPGKVVASFALPMPLNALEIINDCIRRVYGTGGAMIRPQGDRIQIVEPADGFGPVLIGKRKRVDGLKGAAAEVDRLDEGALTRFDLPGGNMELTLEAHEEVVIPIAAAMASWFESVGAENYVQVELTRPGVEAEWIFVLQRKDGLTPAELRSLAEKRADESLARVIELEAELAQLRAELSF